MIEQNDSIKERVEQRLYQVMNEVIATTEEKAQEIFSRNNKLVFKELGDQKARVDDIVAYHKVQKKMYDDLFASNQEAIKLHNEIKRVFEDESAAFFSERHKWKSDASKTMQKQETMLLQVKALAETLSSKVSTVMSTTSGVLDSTIITHMCIKNITNDLKQVNLISQRPEAELLKDGLLFNAPRPSGPGTARGEKPSMVEKPILDIRKAMGNFSTDPRA